MASDSEECASTHHLQHKGPLTITHAQTRAHAQNENKVLIAKAPTAAASSEQHPSNIQAARHQRPHLFKALPLFTQHISHTVDTEAT